ncbi:MAG TPA: glutamyl-tRNA reductase [Acidimicrobiia bacterium]|nr:glutamyl-tRNA reductase [Acidimicrobiia bacterium]
MSFVVVGLNHKTVPLPVLERVTVPPAQVPKALRDLAGREYLAEVALLSTCNRTEIYACCTKFHPGVADASEFLAEQSGMRATDLSDHIYSYYDEAAVAHLFGVAAGVDSVILGEGEILGQVREALKLAESEGTAQQSLARIFRHAIEVGKRSRAETGIGRGAVSLSSAAVALAAERLGTLVERRVLVLGAGEMGEGMARSLAGSGVGEVVVAGRGTERSKEVATRVGGRAIPIERLPQSLVSADLVLTSTGASDIIITKDDIEVAMQRRFGRPLLIVDIAVPRDVDPGVAEIPGVTLLDMDDLKAFAESSMDRRRREVARVRRIISAELERLRTERTAREVAPLVSALRSRGEDIRLSELERFRSKLETVDAKAAEAIEALTRGIVAKLLHEPTVRVKEAAGSGRGELYADALSALFDLESD